MTDGDALYRSILAAPFDLAPRLVYADWLEEQGRSGEADRLRQAAAIDSLLNANVTGFSGLTFLQNRGYPFGATGTLQAFMPQAERLFRTWPITDVQILWSQPEEYQRPRHRLLAKGAKPGEWLWERWHRDDADGSPAADDIPRPIFRFLGGRICGDDWYRAFPSRSAAMTALARACVRYGREAAGLPLLVWPEETEV